MALSEKSKQEILQLIFERAYEIEEILMDDDYFLAKLCGISPADVEATSLELARREIKKIVQSL